MSVNYNEIINSSVVFREQGIMTPFNEDIDTQSLPSFPRALPTTGMIEALYGGEGSHHEKFSFNRVVEVGRSILTLVKIRIAG
ncbi:MAG: hypothetical protein NVSMB46_05780 [Candidatus Saccharimonadales bacterium]